MRLDKGLVLPLLGAAVAASASIACALKFQSRYFQHVDCISTAEAMCDAAAGSMRGWGVMAAVFAFVATAFTGYLLLRLRHGVR